MGFNTENINGLERGHKNNFEVMTIASSRNSFTIHIIHSKQFFPRFIIFVYHPSEYFSYKKKMKQIMTKTLIEYLFFMN